MYGLAVHSLTFLISHQLVTGFIAQHYVAIYYLLSQLAVTR